MSENKRSFWSSVPGLVTGLAGLLTGVVGLVTVLIQLNVIGGKSSSDKPSATATTLGTAAAGGTAGGSGATQTTVLGSFTVSPKPLTFAPADPKVKTVTVRNTSATAAISLQPPKVIGENAPQFSAAFDTCSSAPLPAQVSCTIRVTFTPAGPLGTYKATLQIQPSSGAVSGEEVPITASTLLGG